MNAEQADYTSTMFDEEKAARLMAALAHPVRLRILKRLSCANACCCKDIVESISLAQSTVSQHLKILVEAGLVIYAADAQRSRYSLDYEALSDIRRDVDALLETCCAQNDRS